MSGFLGIDPERLAMLRQQLEWAADDLAGVRSSDDLAGDPLATVHRAARALRSWADRCAGLLACRALSGYRPVDPDRGDLRLAVLATWVVGGRQVWSDPLGPAGSGVVGVDATAEARAVGARLRLGDAEALLEADELSWLRAALGRWRHAPGAWSAFVDGLGAGGLVRLADALGRRSASLEADDADHRATRAFVGGRADPTPGSELVLVTATLAALGAGLRGTDSDLVLGALSAMDPQAAARLLPILDVHGHELAGQGEAVLRRWITAEVPWYVDAALVEVDVADRVLGAVLADPVAAAAFLDRMEDRLDVVLFGPNDPLLAPRLVASATDPASTAVADAGRRLRGILDLMRADPMAVSPDLTDLAYGVHRAPPFGVDPQQRSREIRRWLGEVLAPWQPYLAGAADGWGWNPSEGIAALVYVADEPRAAAALGEGLGPAIASFLAAAPAGPTARLRAVDAVAFTSGAVAEVLRDADLDDLAERRELWSLVHTGLDVAAQAGTRFVTGGLPAPLPKLARNVIGIGVDHAIGAVDGDPRHAGQVGARREMARRVATAHLVLAALVERAAGEGRWPAGAPPVPPIDLDDPTALVDPVTLGRLEAWTWSGNLPDELRLELQHALLAVANPADLGDLTASLLDS